MVRRRNRGVLLIVEELGHITWIFIVSLCPSRVWVSGGKERKKQTYIRRLIVLPKGLFKETSVNKFN